MNQEQNELNGNSVEQNTNSTTIPSPELNESLVQPEVSNSSPIENVEVVKPSLDSILNGDGISPTVDAKSVDSLEEDLVNPVSNEIPTENISLNNNIPTNLESSLNEEKIDETISTIPNVQSDAIASNIGNTSVDSEPLNINGQETIIPTIETIDSTPEIPNVGNSVASTTDTLNEPPIAPTIETIDDSLVTNNTENAVQPNLNQETIVSPTIETIENTPTNVTSTNTIESTTDSSNGNTTVNIEPSPVQTPVDDFNAVPVPPVLENEGKRKKNQEGSKKVLIVLLLFILVGLIGFGVYTLLTMAKKTSVSKSIVTKELKLELGSDLITDIDSYATISGYNKENCTIDLTNINMEKVSTYKYVVTCDKASEEGLVIVDDSTKPEVVTTDLILLPNATVKPEDFIEECIDASNCSYEFEEVVNTETLGEQTVTIIVSDEYNNKNTVTASLTISNTAPARYLTCTKKDETLSDISATLKDSYKIGIDASDNFYNAMRISEFIFDNTNAYDTIIDQYKDTEGIHEIIGKATFNTESHKVILKANKTLEELQTELNGNIPQNSNILRAFLSSLGYICN